MLRRVAIAAVILLASARAAWAGVEAWRLSEVFPSRGGDSNIRFIELVAPDAPNDPSCFFPTTRVEVYDAAGTLLGAVSPFTDTVCYPGLTYFLFATPEAADAFRVPRDARLDVVIPATAGQVCFTSSLSRYDCVRWGTITKVVHALRSPTDDSSLPAIPDGVALARRQDTGVVADDFVLQLPTARQPNDGTVWLPPDGGSGGLVDASPLFDSKAQTFIDARPRPDAAPDLRDDAGNLIFPDAKPAPPFLDADPGGGAACTCRLGGRGAVPPALLIVLAPLLLLRRARRSLR